MEFKRDYICASVPSETFGPMGEDTNKSIHKIKKTLREENREKHSTKYINQKNNNKGMCL